MELHVFEDAIENTTSLLRNSAMEREYSRQEKYFEDCGEEKKVA